MSATPAIAARAFPALPAPFSAFSAGIWTALVLLLLLPQSRLLRWLPLAKPKRCCPAPCKVEIFVSTADTPQLNLAVRLVARTALAAIGCARHRSLDEQFACT